MDPAVVKLAAISAGLIGLGASVGFGIAKWQEAKRHALDFVEEETGDAVSKGAALFVDEHSTEPHSHRRGSGGPSQLMKITGNLPTASRVDLDCDEEDADSGSSAAGASVTTAAASTPTSPVSTSAASGSSAGSTGSVPVVAIPSDAAAAGSSSSAVPSPSVHAVRAASAPIRAGSVDLGSSSLVAGHARRSGPVIIGVAGASGSGKTSIAELIAARLTGQRVLSISSDNYYKSLGPGVEAGDYNFDHPSAIDFDLLADQLEALRKGTDVGVPNYDFVHHRRTDKTTHVHGGSVSVVIIDGIFVLWAERVRAQCDIKVFCSEDLDVCLSRRLRRDLVERGRTVESVLRQYVRFVKPGFTQFIAPSMAHADLIVPRARDNHVAISMLARDIQRRADDAQLHAQAATAGSSGAQATSVPQTQASAAASSSTGGAASSAAPSS